MTGGITLLFRIATLAVRRNADLRRETSAVRATAQAAKALLAVGASFPSAVLGGELLGVMSTQLRELLQPVNAVPATQYSRSRRGKFGTGENIDMPSRFWDGVAKPERRDTGKFKSPDAAADKARIPTPALFPSTTSNLSATNRIEDDAAQRTRWQSSDAEDALDSDWQGSAAPPRATKGEIEPVGTMTRQLREYFALERKQSASRLTSDKSKEPRMILPPAATAQRQQPGAGTDSSRTAKQTTLARRLRAFISEPAPGSPSRSSWWEPGEETSPEVSSLRESSFAAPAGMPSLEFAERLATILHQQAAQHGIDLT